MMTMQLFVQLEELLRLHSHGLNSTCWLAGEIPTVYELSSLSFIHGAYLKRTSPQYILPSVTYSVPCHTAVRLIAYIDLSGVNCHACCKCIQLESSLLLFFFFSRRHYSLAVALQTTELKTCHRGHSIFVKYFNALI